MLRLDRLIALTLLVFPLLSPRGSLADPTGVMVDVENPVPNAMTVGSPANTDSLGENGGGRGVRLRKRHQKRI